MGLLRYYGRLARHSGYSIAKGLALPLVRREAVRSGEHAMAYPVATYAPWQTDAEFGRVFATIRRHTLVDEARCAELWSLVAEVREVPGAILEVGVWRGGTGALLAARARSLGIDDPVYLCDTWAGVVKSGATDTYYRDGRHDDASPSDVRSLLSRLEAERDVALLQGVFPDETAREVASPALRLCHIDVDVQRSAADAFDWAWPRLSIGGIVVFDDYGHTATVGVARFVDEQRARPDRLVLHNLNGHGIVVKRS